MITDETLSQPERQVLAELFFTATQLSPTYTPVKTLAFLAAPVLGRVPSKREMLRLTPPPTIYAKVASAVRSLEDKGYIESTTHPFVTARQRGGFTRRAHKWVRATAAGLQLGERLWEVRP